MTPRLLREGTFTNDNAADSERCFDVLAQQLSNILNLLVRSDEAIAPFGLRFLPVPEALTKHEIATSTKKAGTQNAPPNLSATQLPVPLGSGMNLKSWAGGEFVTLALVFSDIVGSTALGQSVGDEAMDRIRLEHFERGKTLISIYGGWLVKTIGDGLMVVFRSAPAALDFALALRQDPGTSAIRIRVGVHIGAVKVHEDDVFGTTVDYASRVVGAFKGDEICLSDPAKHDVDALASERHSNLIWEEQAGRELKGINGPVTLWRLVPE